MSAIGEWQVIGCKLVHDVSGHKGKQHGSILNATLDSIRDRSGDHIDSMTAF